MSRQNPANELAQADVARRRAFFCFRQKIGLDTDSCRDCC